MIDLTFVLGHWLCDLDLGKVISLVMHSPPPCDPVVSLSSERSGGVPSLKQPGGVPAQRAGGSYGQKTFYAYSQAGRSCS